MNIINFLISVILVFAQRQWKTTSEGGGDLYQRPRFVHSPDPVFAVENEETIIKVGAVDEIQRNVFSRVQATL